MGKQTKRQNAKKAREADDVIENPAEVREDSLCCLPHCGEPGEKLTCDHLLCGMDMLKLTRYVAQLKEFRLTCPMCRKISLVHPNLLMKLMAKHLEFKCASFKCGCVRKLCDRSYHAILHPCAKHASYTCKVCLGRERSMLRILDAEERPIGDEILIRPGDLNSFISGLSDTLNAGSTSFDFNML